MSAEAQARYAARRKAEDPEGWLAYRNANRKRWQAANLEKHRAHNRVYHEIRVGRMERPDRCEHCLNECRPQAAHIDYDRPLDVLWLCAPCHSRFDASRRRKDDPS